MASFQAARSASALRMGPCGQVNEWPALGYILILASTLQSSMRWRISARTLGDISLSWSPYKNSAGQLFLNPANEIVHAVGLGA